MIFASFARKKYLKKNYPACKELNALEVTIVTICKDCIFRATDKV